MREPFVPPKPADTAALIKERFHELEPLAERLRFLRSFELELAEITKEKPFRIWNVELWETMLAARDALVVKLASWSKGLYLSGGLFPTLKAKGHIRSFALGSLTSKKRPQAELDWARKRLSIHDKLFPACEGPPRREPNHADLDAIKDGIVKAFEDLVDDRNVYRAHSYEQEGRDTANARMLRFDEQAAALCAGRQALLDLLLHLEFTSFSTVDVTTPSHDPRASDLVDLLLNGSTIWMVGEWEKENGEHLWQRRRAYYERLHREHDARNDAEGLFNDRFLPTGEKI